MQYRLDTQGRTLDPNVEHEVRLVKTTWVDGEPVMHYRLLATEPMSPTWDQIEVTAITFRSGAAGYALRITSSQHEAVLLSTVHERNWELGREQPDTWGWLGTAARTDGLLDCRLAILEIKRDRGVSYWRFRLHGTIEAIGVHELWSQSPEPHAEPVARYLDEYERWREDHEGVRL